MPSTRSRSDRDDDSASVDVRTINATIARVHGMARGRLAYDDVAAVHLALRGHLAVLLDDARELAARMPAGSFDRHRMDIHLQRLTATHARPSRPAPEPPTPTSANSCAAASGCSRSSTRMDPHRTRAATYLTVLAVLAGLLALGIAHG
ncbi:DUF6415 family natural product biosynthesis protein [Streptomyces sp. NPDC059740]|uniref:DUF6415 family natural product biosynthesis protein n=1 Tax=Streptomyces sp. NPDC059740 TaxID=3346926 RepID=UPI0036509C18